MTALRANHKKPKGAADGDTDWVTYDTILESDSICAEARAKLEEYAATR